MGWGRSARRHLGNLLEMPDAAQAVALCDVYAPNLAWAAQLATQAETYTDFRALLDRPDLDAVVVATPDHWHALPTVMACEAGKDVYVEKPTAVTVEESRKMVEAGAAHGPRRPRLGRSSAPGRSSRKPPRSCRAGSLGRFSFVRTWELQQRIPRGHRESSGHRAGAGAGLGDVARPGARRPVQHQPLRRHPRRRRRLPGVVFLPVGSGTTPAAR